MKHLLCKVIGHRWKNFGGNTSKVVGLAHLHPQAGLIELCTRCGHVWDDFKYGFGADEPQALEYRKGKLAEVGMYAQATGLRLRGDWKL
jgi:hypothetical protein